MCTVSATVFLRRAAVCGGAASLLLPSSARAAGSAEAAVTSKVRLEFVEQVNAEESRSLTVVIGLFGNDAPAAVAAFTALCGSGLQVPCRDVDFSAEVTERAKQSKKATLRGCLGAESLPVTYAYSTVWSIQRGKRIDAGALQGKFALRQAPATPLTEASTLSHDAAGLLSVKRGGGSFDFGISTAPLPEYDEDFAVIGRVVEGMDSIAALDQLTVVKAADAFNIEATTASRAKACQYDSPQPFCAQGKPLHKVTLARVSAL